LIAHSVLEKFGSATDSYIAIPLNGFEVGPILSHDLRFPSSRANRDQNVKSQSL